MNKETEISLVDALRTLIDHAQEQYPHFESERGQRDIEAGKLAIAKALFPIITLTNPEK